MLDGLRSDTSVRHDDLGVLEPIAPGIDLHAKPVGQHEVVRGDGATRRRELRLVGKGSGRASAQSGQQRAQRERGPHGITPVPSVVDAGPAVPPPGAIRRHIAPP